MAKLIHTSDLRRSTVTQLSDKLKDERKKLLDLNQQLILGKLKNFRSLREARRKIAQILTVIDEKVTTQVKEAVTKEKAK